MKDIKMNLSRMNEIRDQMNTLKKEFEAILRESTYEIDKMKATIICCNDSIEAVCMFEDDESIKKLIQEVKVRTEKKYSTDAVLHWHTREAPIIGHTAIKLSSLIEEGLEEYFHHS